MFLSWAVALILLPQVVLALLGGLLGERYFIRVKVVEWRTSLAADPTAMESS